MSWTYYDDCGGVYEFCILKDDTWKKDDLFSIFAERVFRLIAMDVGVPVDRIGFGKWGARLVPDEEIDDEDILEDWIKRIESHKTYKHFKKTCEIATDCKYNKRENELMYFTEKVKMAFDHHFNNDTDFKAFKKIGEEIISEALENLEKEEFRKLLKMINRDASWYKVGENGIIKERSPFAGLVK